MPKNRLWVLAASLVLSPLAMAQGTGAAALDAARQAAEAQVDKTLAIIGNQFPMLGGILGILSKPIIDQALNQAQMPEF